MQIIAESATGWLGFEGNELTIGSKVDDPPKLRGTSPLTEHGGGGFAISANFHHGSAAVDGHNQTEMGMIRFEQAEDVRGQASNPKCELNFLLNDGSGTGDNSMRKPLAFVWNVLTRLLLPFFGGSSQMWSPDGRWLTQQQNDGNLVQYDMIDPRDPKAIWSSWTGKID